jgi:hypothetical protein
MFVDKHASLLSCSVLYNERNVLFLFFCEIACDCDKTARIICRLEKKVLDENVVFGQFSGGGGLTKIVGEFFYSFKTCLHCLQICV